MQLSAQTSSRYFYSQDDTFVDIYQLFSYYNKQFFENVLDKCEIKWSKRMTLCAGTCKYQGLGSSTITLSQPLLKYRSSNELKQTILHEMIHAYLFISNPEECKVDGGHGKSFQSIMRSINAISGLNITIFHQFHDQVAINRKHIWRCNGKCREWAPYFGYVRRAMNREPQKSDSWWSTHQIKCGGKFQKVSEPENYKKKKNGKKEQMKGKMMTLDDYVKMYGMDDDSDKPRTKEQKVKDKSKKMSRQSSKDSKKSKKSVRE